MEQSQPKIKESSWKAFPWLKAIKTHPKLGVVTNLHEVLVTSSAQQPTHSLQLNGIIQPQLVLDSPSLCPACANPTKRQIGLKH